MWASSSLPSKQSIISITNPIDSYAAPVPALKLIIFAPLGSSWPAESSGEKNWIVQKELQEKYSQSQRRVMWSLSLILQIKQQIAFWIYTIILKLLFQSSINFDSVHVFIWVIDGFYGKQEVQQNKAKQSKTIQYNTKTKTKIRNVKSFQIVLNQSSKS